MPLIRSLCTQHCGVGSDTAVAGKIVVIKIFMCRNSSECTDLKFDEKNLWVKPDECFQLFQMKISTFK